MSSPLLVGVHQPGDSWLHRCPTGVKLLGLAAFSLTVVLTRSAVAAPVFLGLALLAAAVGGVRLATLARATRAILVLAVVAAGFQWWIDGPAKAVETLVDLVALALAAITVSATTPVNAMLDTLVRAARHKAVDAGQSLSTWLAELIRERLGRSEVASAVAEVMGKDRRAVDKGLAVFDEARKRALNFLDHPVALDVEFKRDSLYQEGRNKRG